MSATSRRHGLDGLLHAQLFMGVVCSVSASKAEISLSAAGAPSASHFESYRYGRGEVGEFVLVEGQLNLVLARLVELRLPDNERRTLLSEKGLGARPDIVGALQLLGTVQFDSMQVDAGVANHPRIGDRVYAAPKAFVGRIPRFQERPENPASIVTLSIGTVRGAGDAAVEVRPEKVFGRHCAILGATGGGKSWTLARLVEQAMRHESKIVLLDATSEYRTFPVSRCTHIHFADPVRQAEASKDCSLPANDFQESDFIALFEPAGRLQGPKLQAAIRSLRLADVEPSLATNGVIEKRGTRKDAIERAGRKYATHVESPTAPFDVMKLAKQLMAECIYPDGGTRQQPDPQYFGDINPSDQTMCLPLAARIHARIHSTAFSPIFKSTAPSFRDHFESFWESQNRVLCVNLGGVSYEHRAREFIVNALGRVLLTTARGMRFSNRPLVVFVDEAHNFLGRVIGSEDGAVNLDAFEIIAREGRKYGLNVCLATQRPRDVTEGVLSQIGTLIVHRLTNDRDREIVERACGEIDRSASAFLASLRAGEAAIIGVDFPIPLTIQVARPDNPPMSDGPDYQRAWSTAR